MVLEEEKQQKANRGQLVDKTVEYLKKMGRPGVKVSVDRLADYFQVSIQAMLTILTTIKQENRIDGFLKREITGNFWQIPGLVSEDEGADSTAIIECYYCGHKYDASSTSCPSCKRATKICTICNKSIAKTHAVACPECKTEFHFSCFESKVKLFSRCPKCREIVNLEILKRNLNLQQMQAQNVSSSLSRMVSIGRKTSYEEKEEEKDPDEDLFDF